MGRGNNTCTESMGRAEKREKDERMKTETKRSRWEEEI